MDVYDVTSLYALVAWAICSYYIICSIPALMNIMTYMFACILPCRSRRKAQLPLNLCTGIYQEVDNVAMHSNPSYSVILTSVRDHSNSVSGTSVDDEQLGHHTDTVSADSQVEDPEEGSSNYTYPKPCMLTG